MRKYKYKETGIEWLGELPEHWIYDRLRDVTIINDKTLSNQTPSDFEFHYLDIGNVDYNGIINLQEIQQLTFEDSPSRARRVTKQYDTVISSVRTNLQAVAYLDLQVDSIIVSTGFFVCRPKFESLFDNKYLYYFLLTDYSKDFFFSRSVGVSYPAINDYKFGSIYLPIPPIKEQKSIAEYLKKNCKKIDKVIEIKEKQLQQIDEYFNSKVFEIITGGVNNNKEKTTDFDFIGNIPQSWRVVRLKNVLSKINSGVTPKGGATSYVNEGIPLIRSQNIHSDRLDLSEVVYITDDTHNDMANSKLQNGDVLLNITGASIGRCYYFDKNFEANVNQHVCILRPYLFITTKYLYYILISKVGQSQIFSGFKGSGREGLNFESIKNFRIPLPKKDEQNKIVNILDLLFSKMNREKEIIKLQLDNLISYKKSLIHECVTGKKQVADISIEKEIKRAMA